MTYAQTPSLSAALLAAASHLAAVASAHGARVELVSARPDGALACYEVTRADCPAPLVVWIDDAGIAVAAA